MKLPVDLFINNEFRPTIKRTTAINPATEETFAEIAAAEVADLNTAIESADKTFRQTWRDLTPGKRTEILFKIAAGIRANAEIIAQWEAEAIGKPISDARDEVALGARIFEYYAGAITKFFGHTIPVARGGFDFTIRQPLGAIAAIVPDRMKSLWARAFLNITRALSQNFSVTPFLSRAVVSISQFDSRSGRLPRLFQIG